MNEDPGRVGRDPVRRDVKVGYAEREQPRFHRLIADTRKPGRAIPSTHLRLANPDASPPVTQWSVGSELVSAGAP